MRISQRGPAREPRPRRDHHQGSPELPHRVARRDGRDAHADRILILDFGSQYTQLIARRVREHARLLRDPPGHARRRGDVARVEARRASSSRAARRASTSRGAPHARPRRPRARRAGARRSATGCSSSRTCSAAWCEPAERARVRPRAAEARRARTRSSRAAPAATERTVWMSHGDQVLRLPPGFEVLADERQLARSPRFAHATRPIYGVQFHPEVVHTAARRRAPRQLPARHLRLRAAPGRWRPSSTRRSRAIRAAGRARAARSAGSRAASTRSVAAALVHRAIGDRLTCIFVDNGLLRDGERAEVERMFREHFGMQLVVGRRERALPRRARAASTDPEKKRKHHRPPVHRGVRGGGREARRARLPRAGHALPGRDRERLVHGPVARRSRRHHNVGGLPERMQPRARRAAARAVQGRGARARPPARPARDDGLAPAVPGPGPRGARARRGHARRGSPCSATPTRSSTRRSARRASTTRSGSPSRVLLPVRSGRRDGRRAHLRERARAARVSLARTA